MEENRVDLCPLIFIERGSGLVYLKGFSYFSGVVVGLVLDEDVDVLQADVVACVPDMGKDCRLTVPTSMVFESGAYS